MAKTVSSAGLQDFIATGKPTQVFENDQTSKAMAKRDLNTKLAAVDSPTEKPPEKTAESPKEGAKAENEPPKASDAKPAEEDNGLEPEDHDLAERAKKRIGKKHYEMKKAQEEAARAREEATENEKFAETLFNERELWRKRAEEAEGRAGAPKDNKPKEPENKKPDINDAEFKDDKGQFDWQKYSEKLAEWAATNAVAKDHEKQAEEARKKAQEAADAAARERVRKAQEKYPDWEKKVAGSDIQLQNECLRFMAESEYGMDIAYHLANNPKVAERIKSMSPYLAVAELGKLQTQFEKPADPPAQAASKTVEPPAKPASAAPAPITPISTSGTGSIVVDPAKMDFRQLRAYHRERRKNGLEK